MKASQAKERYDHQQKRMARAIVAKAGQIIGAESILDLGGAGESAEMFRECLPDAALVVAEKDPELWPRLRLDAQEKGYVFVPGDFREAKGRYDLIWLDFCGQWSLAMRDGVRAAAKMLTDDGVLAVTLLAAREAPEIAVDRWDIVPLALQLASGLPVTTLFPYQTGSPMWLVLLSGDYLRFGTWISGEEAKEAIVSDGWWASGKLWTWGTPLILDALGRTQDAAKFRRLIARQDRNRQKMEAAA